LLLNFIFFFFFDLGFSMGGLNAFHVSDMLYKRKVGGLDNFSTNYRGTILIAPVLSFSFFLFLFPIYLLLSINFDFHIGCLPNVGAELLR